MEVGLFCLGALAGACVSPQFGKFVRRWRRDADALPALSSEPVRHCLSPNPGWQAPQKLQSPYADTPRLVLDPDVLGFALYPFIISAVVPRPIGFICSMSKDGLRNLAPYSYFNVMAHDPPYVSIGASHTRARSNRMKDSEQNILETGDFTLSFMSEWFAEAANHTCGAYDRGVDEVALAGLTAIPSVKVKPPRIKESCLHMECRLRHSYEVKNREGEDTARILLAEVVLIHVSEGVTLRAGHSSQGSAADALRPDPLSGEASVPIKDAAGVKAALVDLSKYRPMSRLGGDDYARINEFYTLPRPPGTVKA